MSKSKRKCDYQGYEFGARYLDSVCVDGVLYDADDCDDDGNLREPAILKSCPKCRQTEAMDEYLEGFFGGDSLVKKPSYLAWHLVMDVRRNRGLGSVTFRQYERHVEIVHARRNRPWKEKKRGRGV